MLAKYMVQKFIVLSTCFLATRRKTNISSIKDTYYFGLYILPLSFLRNLIDHHE